MADQSDDGVIRVRAVFDGTSLKTGLDAASSNVGIFSKQVKDSLGSVNKDSQLKELQGQVDALTQQLERMGERTKTSITGSQYAIRGMLEEIGIRAPRAVSRYIASLSGVSAIAASAFSVVGIIGLIELLPQLEDKIKGVLGALVGWDDFAKKSHERLVQQANDQIVENVNLRESYRQIPLAGMEGTTKLIARNKDLQQSQKDAAETMKTFQAGIKQNEAEIKSYRNEWSKAANAAFPGQAGFDKVKEDKEAIVQFNSQLDKLATKWREDGLEIARTSGEIKASVVRDSREIAAARIDAERSVGISVENMEEQISRNQYELGKITLEREIETLETSENNKFAILQKGFEKRKALAATNPNVAAGQADIIRANAEEQTAAQEHEAKLNEIRTRGKLERQKLDNEADLATLAAAKAHSDALVDQEESGARELHADSKLESEALTEELVADEDKRTQAERTALQGRLAVAQQNAEKNKAEIITIQGELETLEAKHQTRVNEIKRQGAREAAADTRRDIEEQLSVVEQSANEQLAAIEKLNSMNLKSHRETSRDWLEVEHNALNQWYTDQLRILAEMTALAKAKFGEESEEYKKLIDKKIKLDKQYQIRKMEMDQQEVNETQAMMMKMFEPFNQGIDKALNKQESFARSMEQSWNAIVTNMVNNILKGLEQYAISLLTQETMAEKSILVSAKDAAAKAWANAPNPIIGAVEAAVTFAAVMAYGSFDRGGIVPNDGFHQLHRQEMVLDAGLSTGIRRAINQGELGGYEQPANRATSSSSSDSSKHFHSSLSFSPNIQLYDKAGLDGALKASSSTLQAQMRKAMLGGGLV